MTAGVVVLGVDGGASKTVAIACTLDGHVVGVGRAGGSNVYATGIESAAETIRAACAGALASAGGSRPSAAVLSLAGADWPEDVDELGDTLHDTADRVLVVNDGIGALYAGLGDRDGVAVSCGTGAATGARGPQGTWFSGFWQTTHGGRELASRALRAVYRAELGIDPPTSLSERLLRDLGEPSVGEILRRETTRKPDSAMPYGRVLVALLDEAEGDDAVARTLVAGHGADLGAHAVAAARTVGLADAPWTLALVGGVFRHAGTVLREALVAQVCKEQPGVRSVDTTLEPAAGAALNALELTVGTIPEGAVARLAAGTEGLEAFHTAHDGGSAA